MLSDMIMEYLIIREYDNVILEPSLIFTQLTFGEMGSA